MAYSYYHRLTKRQQKIYRESDKLTSVRLDEMKYLKTLTQVLEEQLPIGNVDIVERCSQELIDAICQQLQFVSAKINVLERRPHNNYGELHGLYEPVDKGRPKAKI